MSADLFSQLLHRVSPAPSSGPVVVLLDLWYVENILSDFRLLSLLSLFSSQIPNFQGGDHILNLCLSPRRSIGYLDLCILDRTVRSSRRAVEGGRVSAVVINCYLPGFRGQDKTLNLIE